MVVPRGTVKDLQQEQVGWVEPVSCIWIETTQILRNDSYITRLVVWNVPFFVNGEMENRFV